MRTNRFFIIHMIAVATFVCSCSSGDDFIAEKGGNIDNLQVVDKALVPIQLIVSPNSIEVTRGSGTVGDIDGLFTNVWNGETVKVLMLQQGTMEPTEFLGTEICVNKEFQMPDGSVNGSITSVDNQSMYYPAIGSSDFWAYRLDDAKNVQLAQTESAWMTTFQIDGTQDVMVAKAVPTAHQEYCFSGYAAARWGLQPSFSFRHLLTRLTFSVIPATEMALGVTVDSIVVASYSQGTLTIAATDDEVGEKQTIEWNKMVDKDEMCLLTDRVLNEKGTSYAIDDALLVAPDTEYKVRVSFRQNGDKHYSEYTIAPETGATFLAGSSYHIRLLLHGYEAAARVSLEPWDDIEE